MHSIDDKLKYFLNVLNEIYDIISDAMDLGIITILKMINKHLGMYNKKGSVYKFHFTVGIDSEYTFIMSVRNGYKFTPLFQDGVDIKMIIRDTKIDLLFNKKADIN